MQLYHEAEVRGLSAARSSTGVVCYATALAASAMSIKPQKKPHNETRTSTGATSRTPPPTLMRPASVAPCSTFQVVRKSRVHTQH